MPEPRALTVPGQWCSTTRGTRDGMTKPRAFAVHSEWWCSISHVRAGHRVAHAGLTGGHHRSERGRLTPVRGEEPRMPARRSAMLGGIGLRFSLVLVAALAILATFTFCVSLAPPAEAERKKMLNIAAKEPDSARSSREHDRTVAVDLALSLPRADAVCHQGRPGHDGRVRARPGRELDDLARRHPVDVQAPARGPVPQGLRRDDGGGREVQLRATDPAGAGHAVRRQSRDDQDDRGHRSRIRCRSPSRPSIRSSRSGWSAINRATSSRRRRWTRRASSTSGTRSGPGPSTSTGTPLARRSC